MLETWGGAKVKMKAQNDMHGGDKYLSLSLADTQDKILSQDKTLRRGIWYLTNNITNQIYININFPYYINMTWY